MPEKASSISKSDLPFARPDRGGLVRQRSVDNDRTSLVKRLLCRQTLAEIWRPDPRLESGCHHEAIHGTPTSGETSDGLWNTSVFLPEFSAMAGPSLGCVAPQAQDASIAWLTPRPSDPELSGAPSMSYRCKWARCGDILENGSVATIKRHLREVHHTCQADCPSGLKDCCKWAHEGGACDRLLDIKSFAKHIASVHLKSTAVRCVDCGTLIGRVDSLNRHRRDHCTARRDLEEFEYAAARMFNPLQSSLSD